MKRHLLIFIMMLVSMVVSAQNTYQKYIDAAKKGDADAQYMIGTCYSKGTDVEKDEKKAVYWWGKAAKQGHAISQGLLGNAYDVGKGVEKDLSQAVYWFRKAAEQGFDLAQTSLAFCYNLGKGVISRWDRYLGMTAAMTQVPVPTARRIGQNWLVKVERAIIIM